MPNQQIVNLSEFVRHGELFSPPGDPDRVEAFIPTPVSENHASNLVELSNGDLLCTWFAGTEEGNRDIKILLSRLPAGGGAWAEPLRLSDDYNRSEQNPMLFVAPDGKVHLFWTAQETRGGLRSDWNARKARGEVHGGFTLQWTSIVRRRISADNGRTWGPIETAFSRPSSFIRHPIIVMSNGEWLFPFYYSLETEAGDHADDYSVMLISNDEGQTWHEYEVPHSRGRVHASVHELAPGKLIAFFRSRAADRIYVSRSEDFGRTWTVPERTALPNNNASMRSVVLQSGALAIIFNNYSAQMENPAATLWPQRRWPVTLALSEDGGQTWPYMRHVETGDDFAGNANEKLNRRLSYPYILQSRDGDLHITYSYRDRQCIKYVRVSERWIRDLRSDLHAALAWK